MKLKPMCKLGGTDGNVYAIIGKVVKALKDEGLLKDAEDFAAKALGCGSYDEVLRLVMEVVEVE